MKIISCLILLLFSANVYSQVSTSENPKSKEPGKIQIGIYFSPDRCYRTLKSNDTSLITVNNINMRNNFEIACIGFTSGLSFLYNLNKIFAFETGLQLANKRYQTKELTLLWGFPFGQASRALHIYNHYYVEIRLKLKVSVGSENFKMNIGFGVAPALFLHYTNTYDVFDSNDKLTESKSKKYSGFNKVNLSLLANLGFSYNLNKKSGICLVPTYRYGMIKIKNEPIREYLWSIGIMAGYHITI